jgi:hypothetical protein
MNAVRSVVAALAAGAALASLAGPSFGSPPDAGSSAPRLRDFARGAPVRARLARAPVLYSITGYPGAPFPQSATNASTNGSAGGATPVYTCSSGQTSGSATSCSGGTGATGGSPTMTCSANAGASGTAPSEGGSFCSAQGNNTGGNASNECSSFTDKKLCSADATKSSGDVKCSAKTGQGNQHQAVCSAGVGNAPKCSVQNTTAPGANDMAQCSAFNNEASEGDKGPFCSVVWKPSLTAVSICTNLSGSEGAVNRCSSFNINGGPPAIGQRNRCSVMTVDNHGKVTDVDPPTDGVCRSRL